MKRLASIPGLALAGLIVFYLACANGVTSALPADLSPTTLAIAASSQGGAVFYLGTEQGEIFRSSRREPDWKALDKHLPGPVLDIAVSTSSGDELLVGTTAGLFRSADTGRTWTGLTGPRFKRVWEVALPPGYPEDRRIGIVGEGGTYGDGAFVSEDGGGTWQIAPEPRSRDIQFVSDGRLAGAANVRAWIESPPGQHLASITAAAEDRSVSRATFSPDYPADGVVFYGGAYTGWVERVGSDKPAPIDLGFRLWLRGDWCGLADESWAGYGPSPNCFIPVAVSPTFAADGLAMAVTEKGLLRSTDRGLTWQPVRLPVPSWEPVRAIAISPEFASDRTAAVVTSKRFLVTLDAGDSWTASPDLSESPPDPSPTAVLSTPTQTPGPSPTPSPTATVAPSPTPVSDLLQGVTLTLRAEPVEGSARTYRLIAEIVGGPDDNRALYCRSVVWDFGDGIKTVTSPLCVPWSPGSNFSRRFEETHSYGAGPYPARFSYGPLAAATVIEVSP